MSDDFEPPEDAYDLDDNDFINFDDDDNPIEPSNIGNYKIKDDIKNKIPPQERNTRNIISKYERTRILSERVEQLRYGAKPHIDLTNHELKNLPKDSFFFVKVAELELEKKLLPIIVRRYLPNGKYEDWKLSELAIL